METKDPENIFINDSMLVCNQCENESFYSSKYDPAKSGLNFPGLEWLNKTVEVFICSKCGFVHMFSSAEPLEIPAAAVPENKSEDKVNPEEDPYGMSDPIECMSCGKVIPKGYDRCLSCGWTYKGSTDEDQ